MSERVEARQSAELFCVGRASKWFLGNFNLVRSSPCIDQRQTGLALFT
jgi:hypothetical protein